VDVERENDDDDIDVYKVRWVIRIIELTLWRCRLQRRGDAFEPSCDVRKLLLLLLLLKTRLLLSALR